MDGLLRLLGSVSWVLTPTGGGGKLPKLGKDGGGGGGNSTVVGAGPISAGGTSNPNVGGGGRSSAYSGGGKLVEVAFILFLGET